MGAVQSTARAYANLDKANGAIVLNKGKENEERWERGGTNLKFVGCVLQDKTFENRTNRKATFKFVDGDNPDGQEIWLETSSDVFIAGLMNKLLSCFEPFDNLTISAYRPKDKPYLIAMVNQGAEKIYGKIEGNKDSEVTLAEREVMIFDAFSALMLENFGKPLVHLDERGAVLKTFGGAATAPPKPAEKPAPAATAPAENTTSSLTFKDFVAMLHLQSDPTNIKVIDYNFVDSGSMEASHQYLVKYKKLYKEAQDSVVAGNGISGFLLNHARGSDAATKEMVEIIAENFPTPNGDDLPF
jgi:hypothetical protein